MWIDDEILKSCKKPFHMRVWSPESAYIVLGNSNTIEREVYLDAVAAQSVPVLKRCGGGGTVVLFPGCTVISFGTWVKRPFENKLYFKKINGAVIDALSSGYEQLKDCCQRGLSDLCWQDRKFGGTSLFRSRNYLLYQASLIVANDLSLISELLQQPSQEPDYRAGRSHAEFIVGLREIVNTISPASVNDLLRRALPDLLEAHLSGELVDPIAEQFPHLLKRAGAVGSVVHAR